MGERKKKSIFSYPQELGKGYLLCIIAAAAAKLLLQRHFDTQWIAGTTRWQYQLLKRTAFLAAGVKGQNLTKSTFTVRISLAVAVSNSRNYTYPKNVSFKLRSSRIKWPERVKTSRSSGATHFPLPRLLIQGKITELCSMVPISSNFQPLSPFFVQFLRHASCFKSRWNLSVRLSSPFSTLPPSFISFQISIRLIALTLNSFTACLAFIFLQPLCTR